MTDRPDDSDPRPVARPAAVQTAAAVAQRFLEAIIWAEHLTVWEMLAPSAREVALAGAGRRGLDAVAAERARLGTWNETQRDALLGELVSGLRVDLAGAPLDELLIGATEDRDDGRIAVELEARSVLPDTITAGHGWHVARLVLVPLQVDEGWLIERIER